MSMNGGLTEHGGAPVMSPSKLADELRKHSNVERKLDQLLATYGSLFRACQEMQASHAVALARLETLEATNYLPYDDVVRDATAAVLEKISDKDHPRSPPEYMTCRGMTKIIGIRDDVEVTSTLKFLARKHAMENGLEIRKGADGKGKSDGHSLEWFPIASCNYAIAEFRKIKGMNPVGR